MAANANRLLEEYKPRRRKALSAETPVWANLDKLKQKDDFIVSILGITNQYIESDSNLEKFQKETF